MTENNIERFNECTAQLFAKMYEKFPMAISFQASDFDHGQNREDKLLFNSTVKWLQDAGYINVGGGSIGGGFHMVVLTEKGLEALNAVPDGLKVQKSLGATIQEAVTEGAIDLAKDTVKQVIKSGVAFGAGAIG